MPTFMCFSRTDIGAYTSRREHAPGPVLLHPARRPGESLDLRAHLTDLAIPSTLALVAIASPRRAGLAIRLAILLAVGAAFAPWHTTRSLRVRVDLVTGVMLLLVAPPGVVIVRCSRTCLHGDPGATEKA